MYMVNKVYIDPLVNINYASFYIEGLIRKFGKENIHFRAEPFNNLNNTFINLNFVVVSDSKEIRYTINLDDTCKINNELYEWSNKYGSVNTNFGLTPKCYHQKLVPLVPSFGIRVWNPFETFFQAMKNLSAIEKTTHKRKYLGKYKQMITLRLPYRYYCKSENTLSNYAFHLSTLWYNDKWNNNDDKVNQARADFIRACKLIELLRFEGGLVPQKGRSSEEKFKDCLYDNQISMKKWLNKTKESSIVFNTPAFWDCHGWKLGEYLALGKAIISTPLKNDLPEPLIHGINIHYVDNNIDAIRESILFILKNDNYRTKLENGSSQYWQKLGTPERSLELLGII